MKLGKNAWLALGLFATTILSAVFIHDITIGILMVPMGFTLLFNKEQESK